MIKNFDPTESYHPINLSYELTSSMARQMRESFEMIILKVRRNFVKRIWISQRYPFISQNFIKIGRTYHKCQNGSNARLVSPNQCSDFSQVFWLMLKMHSNRKKRQRKKPQRITIITRFIKLRNISKFINRHNSSFNGNTNLTSGTEFGQQMRSG